MVRKGDIQRFTYSRNGNGAADEQCPLRITIPSISTVEHHVHYHVHVINTRSRHAWRVSHRYSEFLELHDTLLKCFADAAHPCPGCLNFNKAIRAFEFPPKHVFTSNSPVVLNYRKRALRAFLALLASHTFNPAPKCPICKDVPFTAVRDFLVTQELQAAPGSPVATDCEAIRQSLDIKDFTRCVEAKQLKAVDSEGKFIKEGHGDGSKKHGSPTSSSPSPASANGSANKSTNNDEDATVSPAAETKTSILNVSLSFGSTDSTESRDAVPPPAPTAEPTSKEPDQVGRAKVGKFAGRSGRDSIDNEFGSLNMDFLGEAEKQTSMMLEN